LPVWQSKRLPYNSVVKTILALETSCDETAVAILRGRDDRSSPELLASEVASQIAEHEKYGGIVPEIASRNHLVYAPRLLNRTAKASKIDLSDVDAFAATSGPGLASSLMVGASIAKGLAIGFGKPYLAINHLEGHLLSPFFGGADGEAEIRPAGEAFDKVAKMLGLAYPGGPEIEKLARGGDPNRFDLPRSMLGSENFSFSGLKTAVRYLLPKIDVIPSEAKRSRGIPVNGLSSNATGSLDLARDDVLADLCASFQQAIIDVLVTKTIAAAQKYDVDLVTVSGGVSCNQELRRQLHEACSRSGFEFKNAEPSLCTDNAAMIAFAALLRLQAGFESQVTEEIDPNLALVR